MGQVQSQRLKAQTVRASLGCPRGEFNQPLARTTEAKRAQRLHYGQLAAGPRGAFAFQFGLQTWAGSSLMFSHLAARSLSSAIESFARWPAALQPTDRPPGNPPPTTPSVAKFASPAASRFRLGSVTSNCKPSGSFQPNPTEPKPEMRPTLGAAKQLGALARDCAAGGRKALFVREDHFWPEENMPLR